MNGFLRSRKALALLSLAFTYLFFFEYVPPVRRVYIANDLIVFHYPLADYAFQRLRQGHFPLWDPTIFCGMSFVSNIQAALFYPPTWLMFAFNLGRERLSYQSMQDLVLVHVWIAFLMCYLWLRGKRLGEVPCILGAGVFAFSGYLCSRLPHFGQVAGYAWIPLALWGVDQAVERRSWRPMWKVATASALCLLAGYPPTWMVFLVVAGAYSLAGAWRSKAALGTVVSVIFSLLLCAVQMLPAWEATGLREPESWYGFGLIEPDLVLSYILPNYFNYGLNVPDMNPFKDYLYLGVPALLGLPLLILRRRFRDLMPSLAVLAASLVMLVDPFHIVSNAIEHSTLLPDVVRSWYFLAGVTLAFAPLTAYALDDFLARKNRRVPAWLGNVSVTLMAMWAIYELFRWKTQSFAAGWRSGLDLLVTLAIFGAGMWALRVAQGRRRVWIAAALLLFVGVDYKAFGTSKRFDASAGGDELRYSSTSFPGMMPEVYQQLRAGTDYRIVVDFDAGPLPNDFRHTRMITPQGFDPLLTTPFRKMVETYGHFRTGRMFEVDPENYAALRLFGVRYVISSEPSKMFPKLKDNPHYRLLGSELTYYRVYEYLDAQPPYSWEGSAGAEVTRQAWEPENRKFQVNTASAGKLALHEQLFPGWTAWIDGKSTAVESWAGAFQAVTVPAGDHTVEFRYWPRLLGWGGGISLLALIGLGFWIRTGAAWERKRGTGSSVRSQAGRLSRELT